jgi:pimeloyl-ACP methyl ester carboxylesterase
MLRIIIILLLLTGPGPSPAYSDNYEQRIAAQLVEDRDLGEAVWIEAGGRKSVALYQDNKAEQIRGAVIILHGMGAHPDWPRIINPLRITLPERGWTTLSLQLPVLSPELPIADYGLTLPVAKQRIQAAVQLLEEQGYLNIVVIGHSFGAATTAHALRGKGIKNVKAFVGISMQAQQFLSPRLKLLKQLESIDIPVLDIYGSRDMLEVLREADDRRLAARKNSNEAYEQIVVDGADHYFTGLEDVLINRIQVWLKNVSSGVKVMAEPEQMTAAPAKQEAKTEE